MTQPTSKRLLTEANAAATYPTAASVAATYVPKLSFTKRPTSPLGTYDADGVFPTVAISAGNTATALTGTTVDIFAGDSSGQAVGDWAAGTAYTTGQWAIYNHRSWKAIAGSTGVAPGTDNGVTWTRMLPDARFAYLGSPAAAQAVYATVDGVFANCATNAFSVDESNTQRSITPIFDFFGSSLEVFCLGWGGAVRFTIDGVRDPAGWRALGSDGKTYRALITFAGIDQHRIIAEFSTTSFLGVTIHGSDIVTAPPLPWVPRMIGSGDSVMQAQNTDGQKIESFTYFLGKILGWDAWSWGQGGTGLLNPGTLGGFTTVINRLPTVASYSPDVHLIAVGLNDVTTSDPSYTGPANQTAMAAIIAAAAAQTPNALTIFVGPLFPYDQGANSTLYGVTKTTRDAQVAAVTAAGGVYDATSNTWLIGGRFLYVDTYPLWITGGSGVAGSSGSLVISNDGTHPTKAGHRYYARRIAQAITARLGGTKVL